MYGRKNIKLYQIMLFVLYEIFGKNCVMLERKKYDKNVNVL